MNNTVSKVQQRRLKGVQTLSVALRLEEATADVGSSLPYASISARANASAAPRRQQPHSRSGHPSGRSKSEVKLTPAWRTIRSSTTFAFGNRSIDSGSA